MGTAAYVAYLIALNLFIGHYRDQFAASAGNVSVKEVIDALRNSPLGLRDVRSGMLCLFGMLLSIASMLKTRASQDPYPEYGHVAREYSEAGESYLDAKFGCLEELKQMRDDAVSDLEAAIEIIQGAAHDLQLAAEGRTRLQENYLAHLRHLDAASGQLVRRYREANRASRAIPVPPYFADSGRSAHAASLSPISSMAELESDVRDQVIERIEGYIRDLNEAYERASRELQTIDEVIELNRGAPTVVEA
jgi:hypothetical protein